MSGGTALLFPGQGSQTSDMRDAVERACPDLLELAVELVGGDPFEPIGESTEFAQPAILLASLANFEELGRPKARAFAGHSLGEISALAAAGALTYADALQLVVARGAAMAAAARREGGAMLAVLKGSLDDVEALAVATGLSVANDNAPGQLVLAGPSAAVEHAAAAARARGLRAMRLDVAGAFHHSSMQAALPRFRQALDEVDVRPPAVPVFSGLTAAPFADVRGELALALVRPVRWRETLLALARRGVRTYIDVGPGEVLAGLVRRTLPEVVDAAA